MNLDNLIELQIINYDVTNDNLEVSFLYYENQKQYDLNLNFNVSTFNCTNLEDILKKIAYTGYLDIKSRILKETFKDNVEIKEALKQLENKKIRFDLLEVLPDHMVVKESIDNEVPIVKDSFEVEV